MQQTGANERLEEEKKKKKQNNACNPMRHRV